MGSKNAHAVKGLFDLGRVICLKFNGMILSCFSDRLIVLCSENPHELKVAKR